MLLAAIAFANVAILGVEETPAVGGTYREAVIGQPRSLNPLLYPFDPVGRDLTRLAHAGLVRVTDSGAIRGDLAAGWTTSGDGLVYAFSLDRRARWHDGRAVSAADVMATLEFVRSPSYPGPPELADLWRRVRIEGLDDRTVRFTLTEPYASFIEACSLPILPREAITGDARLGIEAGLGVIFTGAGPFRIESITTERVVLRRNPYYLPTGPWLETVELRFYGSMAEAVDALLAGEVDALAGLPAGVAAGLQNGGRLTVHEIPLGAHQIILLFNHSSALLGDRNVRRAIALSLNRDALLDRVPSWGVPAYGPIPATSWAHSAAVELHQDLDQARRILDESGWRGAPVRSRQQRPLQLQLLVPALDHLVAAAEEVAAQLRAAGFRIDVQPTDEIDLYRERILPRNYDLALLGVWLGSVDPDPYPLWHSSQRRPGLNLAEYSDAATDAALTTARRDGDPGRRFAALDAFQRRWAEDVPSVVLASPVMRYAMPTHLRGVELGIVPEPEARFQHVSHWYAQSQRGWAFLR